METEKKVVNLPIPICVYAVAFGFFNLSWSIIIANISNDSEYVVGTTLAMVTATSIVITWGSALYGAKKLSCIVVLFSLILWSVFVVFWIMTILITCAANISVTLVDRRGPESFWLTSNEYNRDISSEVNYEYYYYSSPAIDTVIDSRYIYYGDERDDDLEPVRKSHMFNHIFLKWLLIVLNFAVFACLVFGAWYVLICFYQEINNLRLCQGLTPQTDAECRVTCCRLLQLKSINSYRG